MSPLFCKQWLVHGFCRNVADGVFNFRNTIKFYLEPIYIVKQVTWKGETENSEDGFEHCKIDMNLFAIF